MGEQKSQKGSRETKEYRISFRIQKNIKAKSEGEALSRLRKYMSFFRESSQFKFFDIVADTEEIEEVENSD